MASLTLFTLQATPTLPTRNTSNQVSWPGVQQVIWTVTQTHVDPEWPDGSTQPITFTTPASNATPYQLDVALSGIVTFTQQYAGQQYNIVASLPLGVGGAQVAVFQSSTSLTAPASIPNPPPPVPIQCTSFVISNTFTIPAASPVPFRLAGDFTWSLQFAGGTLPRKEFAFML